MALSACSGELMAPGGWTESSRTETASPSQGSVRPPPPMDPGTEPVQKSWQAQCASCHGEFSGSGPLSSGNLNGDFRIDAAAAMAAYGAELAAYIENTMPLEDPSACTGTCAEAMARIIEAQAGSDAPLDCEDSTAYGVRRLSLLTSREYQRSLEILLSVQTDYGATVANNDGSRDGFSNNQDQRVNGTILDQYLRNAEAIAEDAVRNGLPFTCNDSSCADRFVHEFLPWAFRGPVPESVQERYRQLFARHPDSGLQQALETALASPRFLYRIETGRPAAESSTSEPDLAGPRAEAPFVLQPHELASALSFMLTGRTPDRELLQAAQTGQLSSREQIRAQVVRLLDSPEGREHVGHFVTQWFGLDAVLAAQRPDTPEFTPQLKRDMVEEVRLAFLRVFYDPSVPFTEFFSTDTTFVNRRLAQFYGIPGNFGETFEPVAVEGRGGPLASGAFMAANAHTERTAPILRAVRAREMALCHHVEPPNAPIAGDDIDAQRAAAQAKVAEREQREGALSSRDFYFLYTDGIDACATCHEKVINPMFGMEDFDHVGRLRPRAGSDAVLETIRGVQRMVSLHGTLFGVDSTHDSNRLDFVGTKDFSETIANTDAVKRCLVRRSFRFLTGLPLTDRDVDNASREALTESQRRSQRCLQEKLERRLEETADDPKELFIELATDTMIRQVR